MYYIIETKDGEAGILGKFKTREEAQKELNWHKAKGNHFVDDCIIKAVHSHDKK